VANEPTTKQINLLTNNLPQLRQQAISTLSSQTVW